MNVANRAIQPEHVWLDLMLVMDADNGCHHDWAAQDMRDAVPAIGALLRLGFFADGTNDLDGSFWQAAAGEETDRRTFFAAGIEHLEKLDEVLNRVFDGESIGNPDKPIPEGWVLASSAAESQRKAEADTRRLDAIQAWGGVILTHWGDSNPWTAEASIGDDGPSIEREGDNAREALDALRAAIATAEGAKDGQ